MTPTELFCPCGKPTEEKSEYCKKCLTDLELMTRFDKQEAEELEKLRK